MDLGEFSKETAIKVENISPFTNGQSSEGKVSEVVRVSASMIVCNFGGLFLYY